MPVPAATRGNARHGDPGHDPVEGSRQLLLGVAGDDGGVPADPVEPRGGHFGEVGVDIQRCDRLVAEARAGQGGAVPGPCGHIQQPHARGDPAVPQHRDDQAGQRRGRRRAPDDDLVGLDVVGVHRPDLRDQRVVGVRGSHPGRRVGRPVDDRPSVLAGREPALGEGVPRRASDGWPPVRCRVRNPGGQAFGVPLPVHQVTLPAVRRRWLQRSAARSSPGSSPIDRTG